MVMADWITKYPQVHRLLQHPDEVLDYTPDGPGGLTVPECERRLRYAASMGACWILDQETPRCVRHLETWLAWYETHSPILAAATYGTRTCTVRFWALRSPDCLQYDWSVSLEEPGTAGGVRERGCVYREKAGALAVYAAVCTRLAAGEEVESRLFHEYEAPAPGPLLDDEVDAGDTCPYCGRAGNGEPCDPCCGGA
jgi:hypothetical protein